MSFLRQTLQQSDEKKFANFLGSKNISETVKAQVKILSKPPKDRNEIEIRVLT